MESILIIMEFRKGDRIKFGFFFFLLKFRDYYFQICSIISDNFVRSLNNFSLLNFLNYSN